MTLKGEVENAARAYLKAKEAWVVARRQQAAARTAYEESAANLDKAATELQRAVGFTAEDRRKGTAKTQHIMLKSYNDHLLRVVANLDGSAAVSTVEYDS